MDFWKWNAAVATAAGVALGATLTAFVAAALRGPTAGDWLQFSATLLGAGATIFAGWLALRAVYTQIDHQKAERTSERERSAKIARLYSTSLLKGANEALEYFKREIVNEGIKDISIHTDDEIVSEAIDIVERNMIYVSEIDHAIGNLDPDSISRVRAITSAADDFVALHDLSDFIAIDKIYEAINCIKSAAEAGIEHFGSHSAASDPAADR